MLTAKQKELLMLIHTRIQETGVPPSFDEMKDALDLKSKSGIHRLITALEERGFIRRLAHRARALEIIKLPDAMMAQNAPAAGSQAGERHGGFQPNVILGGGHKVPPQFSEAPAAYIVGASVNVPVCFDRPNSYSSSLLSCGPFSAATPLISNGSPKIF